MKPNIRHASARWFLAMVMTIVPTTAFAAEDSLTAARDLYAAAAYEDALALLNRIGNTSGRAEDSRAVEQYRAFCLLALGRATEAERAIEAVIAADPSYQPSQSDVSPRVRTAFSEVRRRVLPNLVQQKYADARGAFERKEWVAAAEGFGFVLQLFADPDVGPAANQPPLSDLRTLALGFRDLSLQAAAPPPPPPAPKAEAVQQPPPIVAESVVAPPKIYSSADADVTPPVVVKQWLPPFPGSLSRALQGMLEIVISETGSVESAIVRASAHPNYDKLAVGAAATWQYKPATVNGRPVKYRKFIQMNLKAGGE